MSGPLATGVECAIADAQGDLRFDICGNWNWLWAEGKRDEAAQLEQLCDDLARAENVDVLCVYPLPQGQDEIPALDSIFAQHSAASYR